MKILVLPRDDFNPYQRLLYEPLERRGDQVAYAGELTPSHTLNVLLLPLELVIRRLAGWRILHLHWVYYFTLPALGRHASAAWFRVTLAAARLAGIRLVWTAHNVLPHEPVFPDDVSERRRLIGGAALVIAHSEAALAELAQAPANAVVIPHGPYGISAPREARPDGGPPRLLFFGQVAAYKGVEDLLVAYDRVAGDVDLDLTIAGHCNDTGLRQRLTELGSGRRERVALRLARVPEEQLPTLLAEHDALVLPFRHATTSGSVMLGLEAGLAVVVPALPAFDGMPVMRHAPGVDGIARALCELSQLDRSQIRAQGERGRAWIAEHASWENVAERTAQAFESLVTDGGRIQDLSTLNRAC